MDELDQILNFEEKFQRKNILIIEFFNRVIDTEDKPKVMEIYQYSLNCYLESIEGVDERIHAARDVKSKLRLLTDRDMYLDYVMSSNGIKNTTDEDKKKKTK